VDVVAEEFEILLLFYDPKCHLGVADAKCQFDRGVQIVTDLLFCHITQRYYRQVDFQEQFLHLCVC